MKMCSHDTFSSFINCDLSNSVSYYERNAQITKVANSAKFN